MFSARLVFLQNNDTLNLINCYLKNGEKRLINFPPQILFC